MSEIDLNEIVRKYVTGSCTAPAELVGDLCDALEVARAEVAYLSLGGNAWFEERQAAVTRAETAEAQVAAVRALCEEAEEITAAGRAGGLVSPYDLRPILDGTT